MMTIIIDMLNKLTQITVQTYFCLLNSVKTKPKTKQNKKTRTSTFKERLKHVLFAQVQALSSRTSYVGGEYLEVRKCYPYIDRAETVTAA